MASWLLGCLLPGPDKYKCRVFCDHPSPAQVFVGDLARSLEELHESSSSDLLSGRWLCAAMDVVITTQETVKEALCKHPLQGAMEQVQVQQFFEDSVKLLDVCCMLEDGLGNVKAYAKDAQIALRHVSAGSESRIRAKKALLLMQKVCAVYGLDGVATPPFHIKRCGTTRLMTSSSMLRRMGSRLNAPEACSDDVENLNQFIPSTALPATLYGAEMVTLFFFRLLVTIISLALKPCKAVAVSPLRISAQTVWTHPLLLLQAHLKKWIPQISADMKTVQRPKMPISTLVHDLHMIDISLNKISELLVQTLEQPTSQELRENLRHHGEATLKRVQEIEGYVNKLQNQLKIVSRLLIDVRMVLLDCQNHP